MVNWSNPRKGSITSNRPIFDSIIGGIGSRQIVTRFNMGDFPGHRQSCRATSSGRSQKNAPAITQRFPEKMKFKTSHGRIKHAIGVPVHQADLAEIDLMGIDCAGMSLPKANFTGAILTISNFDDADLTDAKFNGAILQGVSFRGTKLKGADFSGADLSEACFFDADLSGADLSESIIHHTDFQDAWADHATRFPPRFHPDANGIILQA